MAVVFPAAATAALAAETRRPATKRPRAPRKSVTDSMETMAEQLWSATWRGLMKFESIAPTNMLPRGGVGVVPGPKGSAAFCSYLKQPKVIARLQAEGFEPANWGEQYQWVLTLRPGVTSPAQKARFRSLTEPQRARIEANRVAALEIRRQML